MGIIRTSGSCNERKDLPAASRPPGVIRLLKPALFFYECVRLLVIATYTVIIGNQADLPLVSFAASSALFPLMALFIWLDTGRFKAYLPLYTAGKCISIFILLVWSIFFRQVTMVTGGGLGLTELMLISGDLFAMAAVLLITRDINKVKEESASEVE
jgi:hypothetical protein